MEHDPIRPARGCLNGLLLSLLFWGLIGIAIYIMTR